MVMLTLTGGSLISGTCIRSLLVMGIHYEKPHGVQLSVDHFRNNLENLIGQHSPGGFPPDHNAMGEVLHNSDHRDFQILPPAIKVAVKKTVSSAHTQFLQAVRGG